MSIMTPKRLIAATAIALGETHKKAATLVNVTPGTISEWMSDPFFKAKMNEIQLKNLTEAQNKFRGLARYATEALEKLLADAKSDNIKLEAAKYVLDKIQIAPAKEGGLWWIGATTADEVESEEHTLEMRKRLKALRDELHLL